MLIAAIGFTCPTHLHTIGLNESFFGKEDEWNPFLMTPAGGWSWEPCPLPWWVGGAGNHGFPGGWAELGSVLPPSPGGGRSWEPCPPFPRKWAELGTVLPLPQRMGGAGNRTPRASSSRKFSSVPPRKSLASQFCVEQTFTSPQPFFLFPDPEGCVMHCKGGRLGHGIHDGSHCFL